MRLDKASSNVIVEWDGQMASERCSESFVMMVCALAVETGSNRTMAST